MSGKTAPGFLHPRTCKSWHPESGGSQWLTRANREQPARTVPPVDPTEAELFANDPLLSAIGLGKELWADEHADKYVTNLRKD
jgi:hypothetical protein